MLWPPQLEPLIQCDVRFTPKADFHRHEQHVRFVPKADIIPLGLSHTAEPSPLCHRLEANKDFRALSWGLIDFNIRLHHGNLPTLYQNFMSSVAP